MSRLTRSLLVLAAPVAGAALLATSLVAPAEASRGHGQGGHGAALPARIDLPDGFQPEGIDTRGPTAYLGSRADGDIYAADLRTGRGRVLSQGDGTPAVGIELGRGRDLWAAGGADGDVKVVDTRTGRVRATYPLVADPRRARASSTTSSSPAARRGSPTPSRRCSSRCAAAWSPASR